MEKSDTYLKSFVQTRYFEAWRDERFVYIHMRDKGVDIHFEVVDFIQFAKNIQKTVKIVKEQEKE